MSKILTYDEQLEILKMKLDLDMSLGEETVKRMMEYLRKDSERKQTMSSEEYEQYKSNKYHFYGRVYDGRSEVCRELKEGISYAIDELLDEENSLTHYYLCTYTKKKRSDLKTFDNILVMEILERTLYNLFDSEKVKKIYPDNEAILMFSKYFCNLKYQLMHDIFIGSQEFVGFVMYFFDAVSDIVSRPNNDIVKLSKINSRVRDVGWNIISDYFGITNELFDELLRPDIKPLDEMSNDEILEIMYDVSKRNPRYFDMYSDYYYDQAHIDDFKRRCKDLKQIIDSDDSSLKKELIIKNIIKAYLYQQYLHDSEKKEFQLEDFDEKYIMELESYKDYLERSRNGEKSEDIILSEFQDEIAEILSTSMEEAQPNKTKVKKFIINDILEIKEEDI